MFGLQRVIIGLLVLAFAGATSGAGRRLALVIGNDNYSTSNLSSLSQARADAAAIAGTLELLGFAVTTATDADRGDLFEQLNHFEQQLQTRPGEVALIYYAGHGAQYRDQPWLLPVDASIRRPSDIEAMGIPLSRLQGVLVEGGWQAGVIVLDACRNELFAGGRAPAGWSRSSLPRGLAPVEAGGGLLIAYATAAGEVAMEQAGQNNSVYTAVLLEKLREPGLDLFQIFNGSALEVRRRHGVQRPELMVSALEEIILAGPATPKTAPLTPDKVDANQLQQWYNRGRALHTGHGVPRNDAAAATEFRRAAEHGHAPALFALGYLRENGLGVPKDEAEAVRLYRLAAEQGHATAQMNLGFMYSNGKGVPKDEAEAVRLYRLAAEQGDATAQTNLGVMYEYGKGVPKDEAEAMRWYRLAAAQGHAEAQYYLGLNFRAGIGVSKDLAEANRWFRLAAAQGHAAAQKALDAQN